MAEFPPVHGLPELKAKFQALPAEIATKVLRKGVGAAAVLLRNAAQTGAPISAAARRRGSGLKTEPGTLRRAALAKYLSDESNGAQIVYIVTFRKGKGLQKSGKDAFYAGWVNFGHRIVPRSANLRYGRNQRFTRLKNRRAAAQGRVEGVHFLDKSFAGVRGALVTTMTTVWSNEFNKLYP